MGDWKREPNSTLAKLSGRTVINDTYALPEQVGRLMRVWLAGFDKRRRDTQCSSLEAYLWTHATFVRIHPYADGNGRMARLLANLPVIEKGHLPILIPVERRLDYIEALASWQLASGRGRAGGEQELSGDESALNDFRRLCADSAEGSDALLEEVQAIQALRRASH